MSLKTFRNIAIIAIVALAITALPAHGNALHTVFTVLVIALLLGLVFALNRVYREHHYTLESLPDLDRTVLYCSLGLALFDVAAWDRLTVNGPGLVVGIIGFALAALGCFWVFTRYRSYG